MQISMWDSNNFKHWQRTILLVGRASTRRISWLTRPRTSSFSFFGSSSNIGKAAVYIWINLKEQSNDCVAWHGRQTSRSKTRWLRIPANVNSVKANFSVGVFIDASSTINNVSMPRRGTIPAICRLRVIFGRKVTILFKLMWLYNKNVLKQARCSRV